MLTINLNFKPPAKNLFKDFKVITEKRGIGSLTVHRLYFWQADSEIEQVYLVKLILGFGCFCPIGGFDSAAYLLRSHLPEVESSKRSSHLLRRQRHSTYR
jgi:hypothetical protein